MARFPAAASALCGVAGILCLATAFSTEHLLTFSLATVFGTVLALFSGFYYAVWQDDRNRGPE